MTLPVSIYTAITQSQHMKLSKRQIQSSKTNRDFSFLERKVNSPIKMFKSTLLNVLLESPKTSQKFFPKHKLSPIFLIYLLIVTLILSFF